LSLTDGSIEFLTIRLFSSTSWWRQDAFVAGGVIVGSDPTGIQHDWIDVKYGCDRNCAALNAQSSM